MQNKINKWCLFFAGFRQKILPVLCLLLCCNVNAQDPVSQKSMVSVAKSHVITIQFSGSIHSCNLLVLVTSPIGETVFMENQYRFKGEYKKEIDLSLQGRGEFLILVKKDGERAIEKILIQ